MLGLKDLLGMELQHVLYIHNIYIHITVTLEL